MIFDGFGAYNILHCAFSIIWNHYDISLVVFTQCCFILTLAITVPLVTGLHTQKAYTHTGTSSPQILMLSAHAYMHFS